MSDRENILASYADLKQFIDAPDHPSYEAFLALCRTHREAFDSLLAEAKAMQEVRGRSDVGHFSRALWELVDVAPQEVVAFQKTLIADEMPAYDATSAPSEMSKTEWLLHQGDAVARVLWMCEVHTPRAYEGAMAESFEVAWQRLVEHEHVAVRLLARDLRATYKLDVPGDWGEEKGRTVPADADDAYFADAIAMLDFMPEYFEGFQGIWGFTMGRLKEFGSFVAGATPKVLELLERYTQENYDLELAHAFGKVLYELGCDEIPEAIHDAQDPDAPEEYYLKWLVRGQARAWTPGARNVAVGKSEGGSPELKSLIKRFAASKDVQSQLGDSFFGALAKLKSDLDKKFE